MVLPNTLLLTYQAEYETTPDFTIADLCNKYDVTTKQLKGYTKWAKRLAQEPQDIIGELVYKDTSETTNNTSIVKGVLDRPSTPKAKEEILEEIDDFKALAVAHATKFMKNDAEFAEVKEFKDMVAIVDSIEKSYKDSKDTGNTINIAIQNIVKDFKDDC